ncbi:MAG: hypothetical protein JWP44_3088 [Mucilaginibacter sp.]|nr:hypothetical protein [Mucilaginibacter sp.]
MTFKHRWCLKFFLFFLISIFCNLHVYAQNNIYNFSQIKDYKTFLVTNTNAKAALINKSIQKQYLNIISEKNDELLKKFEKKSFLFDSTAYLYLNSIFQYILEKNSLDKTRFHFFIDRTSVVNAYSYEDGTVVCDLGLVSITENESQLAMVFCHELGHYLLDHVNTSLIKQLEKYNSPEFLAHLKTIKKQEYNTKRQLENLLETDVFDQRKHNRHQERAADSLAMLLFLKTGYNCKTVSRVFDLLDSSDSKTIRCSIGSFFIGENIAINEDWLKPESRMKFGQTPRKEIIDSLKTHPDCTQRKIWMQSFFNSYPRAGVDFIISDGKKLAKVKKEALFNEALYLKENDNLGLYLYQLIQNNATFPRDRSIKTEIFNTLLSICNHYKTHTLYMVIRNQYLSDDDKDEYAKLLKLFDSLNFQEMKEITKTYYQSNKSLITASTEAINNLNTLNN